MTNISAKFNNQLFEARTSKTSALEQVARERKRRRRRQATNSLVTNVTGRPEDAAQETPAAREELMAQTYLFNHSISSHRGAPAACHIRCARDWRWWPETRDGRAQHDPKDYFLYQYFSPASSNITTTMSHRQTINQQQQPSHRSQPGHRNHHNHHHHQQHHHRPTHSQDKPARAGVMSRPNNESNQRNAWIPIVATSNRAIATPSKLPVRVSQPRRQSAAGLQLIASEHNSGSSAALLDYPPPAISSPSRQQQQQQQRHHQSARPNRGAQSVANHRPRPRPPDAAHQPTRNGTREVASGRQNRGREIQVAQNSHVHHHRNSYAPPAHSSARHYHHHHYHHHHWAPPPPPQPQPQPHRTPRYQHAAGTEPGPLDNELGAGGSLPSASKMYKRVLLCDKTLVSLDYIRSLDAEPRPYGARKPLAASHLHLSDHEIEEIADNFLDLDGNFDSSLSRSSSVASARPSSNSTTIRGHAQGNVTDSTAAPPMSQPIQHQPRANLSLMANESSAAAAAASEISIDLTEHAENDASSEGETERRGHGLSYRESLLNDQDPLVRCDMWDLEKGLKSRKPPAHILRMAIRADFDTVRDAINRCRQLSERTLPPEDEFRGDGLELMSTEDLVSLFSMKRGLMPGTKWCGFGDQAETYNDLGPKHRIDICCRAHDHCPIRSKPFRNDYGVLNIGLYTKSHCDCDADFYRCLREVRSRTADMLGNLYFNVMKLQCMREERLKVCSEMKPLALGFERCVRYEDSPVKTVFKSTTPPVAY